MNLQGPAFYTVLGALLVSILVVATYLVVGVRRYGLFHDRWQLPASDDEARERLTP
jgi:hypothetical protein